jgi:CubicO group peptidase (beta-lactamase class C family)
MLKRIGLGLLMVLLSHVVSAAPVSPEIAVSDRLDNVVAKAISDNRIVGAVVVVAQQGNVLYFKSSGLVDREGKRPMQKDTVFRLASMTKPLVSVAVLRLVDQRILKLDDPVTKWLPDFKPRTADGKAQTITIRQLLTHTSGLNYGFLEAKDGPYHRLGVSDGLNDIGISLDENLNRLSQAPLLFTPGTSWQYSLGHRCAW